MVCPDHLKLALHDHIFGGVAGHVAMLNLQAVASLFIVTLLMSICIIYAPTVKFSWFILITFPLFRQRYVFVLPT